MTEESRGPSAISSQCLEPPPAIRHSPALFGKGQGDMASDRIYLFDTTLRDGAQTQGVDFGVADKVAIAEALDTIGIDYVEGGWPGANPTDDAYRSEERRVGKECVRTCTSPWSLAQ